MDKKTKYAIWLFYIAVIIACYLIEGMVGLGIILTALGGLVLITHPYRAKNRKLANSNVDKNRILKEYDDEFDADSQYITIDEKIAFNEQQKLIKIYKLDSDNKVIESKINFNQIVDSEIKMNNDVIFKASRTSQIGGALAGGLIAGSVGAIIGGSSPSTSQVEKIKSITLKIRIEDFKNPNFTFDFLPKKEHMGDTFQGYLKDSSEIKSAMEKAEYWNSVITLAIKQSNNQVSV